MTDDAAADPGASTDQPYAAGFACLVGRPNAGKSTLTNALVGEKVAITSSKPQTTRHTIRGIVTSPTSQIVLVDTPGLHKPRTLLGERLNDLVRETLLDVDVVGFCLPADQRIGPGDQFIAREARRGRGRPSAPRSSRSRRSPTRSTASASPSTSSPSTRLGEWAEIVPCSATRGDQVDTVAAVLAKYLPPSPGPLYPDDVLTDEPEVVMIAEPRARGGARGRARRACRTRWPSSSRRWFPAPTGPRASRSWTCASTSSSSARRRRRSSSGAVARACATSGRRRGRGSRSLLGQRVHLDLHVKIAKDWQRDPKQAPAAGVLRLRRPAFAAPSEVHRRAHRRASQVRNGHP